MTTCPNCGKEIEENALKCEHCGASFEGKEEEAPVAEETSPTEEVPPAEETFPTEEVPLAEETFPTEEVPLAEEAPAAETVKAGVEKSKASTFNLLVSALIILIGISLFIIQEPDAGIGVAVIGLIMLAYGLFHKK